MISPLDTLKSPLTSNFFVTVAFTFHVLESPRELGNFDAATESFQKALLLNQNHVQTLQLKGMMLYHHGSLDEALKNFKVSRP